MAMQRDVINRVVNPNTSYMSITPGERRKIIAAINNDTLVSNVPKVRKDNHWKTKHHPEADIPTNIYLLGQGTKGELRKLYERNHGPIPEDNGRSSTCQFGDYMRELVQQGLLVAI